MKNNFESLTGTGTEKSRSHRKLHATQTCDDIEKQRMKFLVYTHKNFLKTNKSDIRK